MPIFLEPLIMGNPVLLEKSVEVQNILSDEIQEIISNNTFVNLRAKMEFINWKKV